MVRSLHVVQWWGFMAQSIGVTICSKSFTVNYQHELHTPSTAPQISTVDVNPKMIYNVTLKEGASPEELQKAKDTATSQGGTIKHEFTLIKGFTVEFPNDAVHTLESNQHLHVEQDGEVKTQ